MIIQPQTISSCHCLHPLFLLPAVASIFLVVSVVLLVYSSLLGNFGISWAIAFIVALLCAFCAFLIITFLLILWLLGCACCRDEKLAPHVESFSKSTGADRGVSMAFPADFFEFPQDDGGDFRKLGRIGMLKKKSRLCWVTIFDYSMNDLIHLFDHPMNLQA